MRRATKKNNYEILIIGGGLIGLCLAVMLGKLNTRILLMDKEKISSTKSIYKDTRTVAVSFGTKLLLEKHNIWKNVLPHAQPINQIRVLNRNENSALNFDGKHINNPMGFIVKHSILKKILIKRIKGKRNIDILEHSKIEKIIQNQNNVIVEINNYKIAGKVLLAADGSNSLIKSICKIPSYSTDYKQSALALNFRHSKSHKNIAYEIFLPNGPLATLPMKTYKKNIYKSSLIWSENIKYENYLKQANKNYLKDIIEEKVQPYLGDVISLDDVKIFPLKAHICRRFADHRIVLVGDAAHSIHPIAGQGWNLGMRDVKYLFETFKNFSELGEDLGSPEALKSYSNRRFKDVYSMFFITHNLNKIFSSKSKIVSHIRSLGFKYINSNSKLTNSLVSYAMGINL